MTDQISIRERIKGLNEEFKAIKQAQAEVVMREGKFNEKLTALVSELTGRKGDETVNITEILYSVLVATA